MQKKREDPTDRQEDDLDQQEAVELPDREAMSIIAPEPFVRFIPPESAGPIDGSPPTYD